MEIWISSTATWIAKNMGEAALSRFTSGTLVNASTGAAVRDSYLPTCHPEGMILPNNGDSEA